LHNPIQETLLDTLRSDVTTFLRNKLNNDSIQVAGELKETTGKKVIYTNREKFEYLVEKNPAIGELKKRLDLDTDF
jgi:DNA polymerase-3 subunit gamma/tau